MNRLTLKTLTPELEPQFWALAESDFFGHYFYFYDWQMQREKTQIYLAMDCGSIVGSMLVFNGSIVQLRGATDAVAFLLSNLQLEKAEVQVPADSEDLLLAKFPLFCFKVQITLMTITRGEERLTFSVQPEPLTKADAVAVADLMRQCSPEIWSEITPDAVSAKMAANEAVWLGIKVGGELAAFGYAMKAPKVSHLTWIATSPNYRCRGYATSIVSALLKEVLSCSEAALIYVIEDNEVAKRVYTSAGFTPHSQYVFTKT